MRLERLRISLFGEPRFEVGGRGYRFNAPPKTLPLLAYLLLHRRGPVARETVAAALWPDADQATAFSNLRRHLHYLGKALPPPAEDAPWLSVSKNLLAWNPESPYWLDVEAFESEIQTSERRAHAVRLYAGDLYERCAEEWIEFERERLRTLQLSNLAQLGADAQRRSAYVEALQYAQLTLAADPWREDALRTIVETRMLLGDRAGAIAEYERFASRLFEELRTRPLAETTQVYERIRHSASAPLASSNGAPATAADELIGRRNELATLRGEWQRASRGEGRVVFLAGEAGIGKSALLRAICDTAAESGANIVRGAATPHEESTYAALEGAAETLGVDMAAPAASEQDRLRAFEAFAAALVERARAAPLVIAVEDLHWASRATLDLLRYAVLRTGDAPLLFVATYREFEVHREHPLRTLRRELGRQRRCTTIALSPLGRDDVRDLAALRAGRPVTDELLDRILERSGGNPLFVTEILRELRDGRGENVPASIAEIVRERAARLSPAAQSFLATCAVAGATLSVELLGELTGLREAQVLQLVDELVGAHFLRQADDGEHFPFLHELIREAVYEQIPAERVRQTHARAGFVLRALHAAAFPQAAANAARHFELGGIEDRACDAYTLAAEHASSVYAIDQAAAYARKALQYASTPAHRIRPLRVLESAAASSSARREQAAYLRELFELTDGGPAGERLDVALRYADFSAGEPADVQREALERLRDVVGDTPAYRLRLGEHLLRVGEMRAAREALESALAGISPESDADAALRCLTGILVTILSEAGSAESVSSEIDALRARLGRQPDARIAARLAFLESGALLDRDPQRALAAAQTMLERAEDAGDAWMQALAHRCAGAAATRSMQIGLARRHLDRCAAITVASNRLRDLARLRSWDIMLENRTANFSAANRYGQEALDAARAAGAADIESAVLSLLANTAVWAGDLARAKELLQASLEILDARGYARHSIASLLGEVLIAQGESARGIALIEDAFKSSNAQDDLLGTLRVHYPLLLAIAYAGAGRFDDARKLAEPLRRELQALCAYYIHPQVYLWSAAQLLRMLGYPEADAFLAAARERKDEILGGIEDETSRGAFRRFIFNRLIDERIYVDDPLQAWYTPYAYCGIRSSSSAEPAISPR